MWCLAIVAWSLTWSLMGVILCFLMHAAEVPLIKKAEGFEIVNPIWIYRTIHVNWFGALMIALFFHALLPIFSLGYWIYKLCTIGRR